jgi:phage N-6-adenine-methyltransferase
MSELVLTDRAALALIDEAEQALAAVDTPEDADELWRKVQAVEEAARLARVADAVVAGLARVRMRAKRRWGELLGPAEPGRPKNVTNGHVSEDGDRKQVERARKLAAIPEETFAAAVEGDDPEKAPSEASVLRHAGGAVHRSSERDDWETPQDLFDALDAEFHFELDVCALESSAKCGRYFTPADDGLAQKWTGVCWMNPPYGEGIGAWMEKARLSAEAGATVVCLVPARVDTGWWWDNCLAGEIRFLRGRLRFSGGESAAPFPSAIVILGREPKVVWWER